MPLSRAYRRSSPPEPALRRTRRARTIARSAAPWVALAAAAAAAVVSVGNPSTPPVPPSRNAAAAVTTPASGSSTRAGRCINNRMGIPRRSAYVGAAVGGTQHLSRLERRVGRRLAVHRTYFSAGQIDHAARTARRDLAAGRLPWISFKVPYSWAGMARGRGDGWARNLARKLARVHGPVWLAFHHEPEGDGNEQDWKRMQRHLAPIIHRLTDNVAYTVIYTAWDALFGPAQFRLAHVWPGSQYVDILGMDMYNNYGTHRDGRTDLPMLDPMKFFRPISRFASRHGVHWALAETGYAPPAVNREPRWLVREFRALRMKGGLALSYFDSSRNSITDWTLDDSRKLSAFRTILRNSPRICSGR